MFKKGRIILVVLLFGVGLYLNAADALYVDENGNVGINGNLTIRKEIGGTSVGIVGAGNSDAYFYVSTEGSGRATLNLNTTNGWNITTLSAGGNLDIQSLSGGTSTTRMTIKNDGNVGIGTTDPGAYKLNVAGSMNVTGSMDVEGGITVKNGLSVSTGELRVYSGLTTLSGGLNVGGTLTTRAGGDFYGGVPVGTIVAWHKNIKAGLILPDGWVECNGQNVDGWGVIPNLNGEGRFLRGGVTSGIFQNDMVGPHTHTRDLVYGFDDNNHTNPQEHWENGDTNDHIYIEVPVNSGTETRPKNMSVIWIMRIK